MGVLPFGQPLGNKLNTKTEGERVYYLVYFLNVMILWKETTSSDGRIAYYMRFVINREMEHAAAAQDLRDVYHASYLNFILATGMQLWK
jgi:hypothetical protein